jgi:hypothetical protein
VTGHIDAETLAEFREGLLPRRRAAQVSAHLAACAQCAESDRGLAGITALLASAPAPPMPAGLSARIEAALAAEAAARAAASAQGGAAAGEPAAPTQSSRPSATTPGEIAADGSSTGTGNGTAGGSGTAAGGAGRAGGDLPARGTGAAGHRAGGRGIRPAARPPAGRPPAGPRRHRRAGDGSRPRSWAALRAGAVAAAVAVIVGGGYGVAQLIGSGTTAGTAASGSAGVRHSANQLQPSRAPSGMRTAGGAGGSGAAASEAGLPVVQSGTNYQPRRLGTQVNAVLARLPVPGAASTPRAKQSLPAPFGTSGLPACVRRVSGGVRPRLVDVATYQGRPAAVVVLPAGRGRVTVLVVGPGCTGAASDVLAQTSMTTRH